METYERTNERTNGGEVKENAPRRRKSGRMEGKEYGKMMERVEEKKKMSEDERRNNE